MESNTSDSQLSVFVLYKMTFFFSVLGDTAPKCVLPMVVYGPVYLNGSLIVLPNILCFWF